MAWHFQAPDSWRPVDSDSDAGSELTPDLCVIRNEDFFVRGIVEIPVLDQDEPFAWGVWVSLSRKNFERMGDLWLSPDRVQEPPYFGWFCNVIPGFPTTLHLKTSVHTREVGVRPYIELEPTDHPLAVEQRNGITMARVREIAEGILHQNAELD